ncbi:hypothetical protein Fmac_032492 [Flemingia macrophylla]|uniref:Uncharacterized protein n=1 Tax=Flemingia macrophylla TaxID=520843 RepID=A0ABD1L556_9FABA
MANLKVVLKMSSTILLAMVLINGVVGGRPMEKGHVATYENRVRELGDSVPLWRRSIMENAPHSHDADDKWIDDFRPTDPGHSPGAGHSSPTPKGYVAPMP